ncbi:MAG: hypothetical protein EZS28_014505 [Streblomastix strix]|uniref:Uncharacterized protein n=1 Tax=Streblomastix strix TaxID=222440 RepID=A0A5J4W4X4_9EUKA|nr:MAG: hypothetical protein EZS28_014505 [Streblomastix strix]
MFNQTYISSGCPVMIFNSVISENLPLVAVFVLFFIFALVAFYETIQSFIQKPLHTQVTSSFSFIHSTSSIIQLRCFLVLVTFFLLFRSALLVIPFPFSIFQFYFICQSLPMILVFLVWQTLALFIRSSVASSHIKNRSMMSYFNAVFFFSILALLGCSLALSLLMTYIHKTDINQRDILHDVGGFWMIILACLDFFLNFLSICWTTVKIGRVFTRSKPVINMKVIPISFHSTTHLTDNTSVPIICIVHMGIDNIPIIQPSKECGDIGSIWSVSASLQ